MTAHFCHNAPDRTAATWHAQLQPWVALEFLVADGARGIAKAVQLVAQTRQDAPSPTPLDQVLDLLHTASEVQRLLAHEWHRADRVVRTTRQAGPNAQRASWDARPAWRLALQARGEVETHEQAWRKARAAPPPVSHRKEGIT